MATMWGLATPVRLVLVLALCVSPSVEFSTSGLSASIEGKRQMALRESSSCCQRSAAVPSLRMIATPRREGKAGDGEIEEEESARHSIMRHAQGGKGKDSHNSPRMGSAMSIQSSFFEEPVKESEDQSIPAKIGRAVAWMFTETENTLMGSESLRVLHDEIVPEDDKLPNNGHSPTLQAVTDTLDYLGDPEKCGQETGGSSVLGSRRIGWAVYKTGMNMESVSQAVGGALQSATTTLSRVVDGDSNPEGIVNIPAMVQGGVPVNPSSDLQQSGGGAEAQTQSGGGGPGSVAANNVVAAGAVGDEEVIVEEHRDGVMPGAGPDGKTKLQLASSKNYRMEFATVKASVEKVYAVASSVTHYPDWCGTGIKSVKEDVRRGDGYVEASYQAGAFGYTFEFGLTWDMEGEGRGPGKGLDFRLSEEAGTIKSLLGGYRFVALPDGGTKIYFEVCAELVFIPGFIQQSIANLILSIAIGELAKYVDTDKCTADLEARGLTLN